MVHSFELDAELAARVARARLDDATDAARAAVQNVRASAEVDWISDQRAVYRTELWHALQDIHGITGRIDGAREQVGAWLVAERSAGPCA